MVYKKKLISMKFGLDCFHSILYGYEEEQLFLNGKHLNK